MKNDTIEQETASYFEIEKEKKKLPMGHQLSSQIIQISLLFLFFLNFSGIMKTQGNLLLQS